MKTGGGGLPSPRRGRGHNNSRSPSGKGCEVSEEGELKDEPSYHSSLADLYQDLYPWKSSRNPITGGKLRHIGDKPYVGDGGQLYPPDKLQYGSFDELLHFGSLGTKQRQTYVRFIQRSDSQTTSRRRRIDHVFKNYEKTGREHALNSEQKQTSAYWKKPKRRPPPAPRHPPGSETTDSPATKKHYVKRKRDAPGSQTNRSPDVKASAVAGSNVGIESEHISTSPRPRSQTPRSQRSESVKKVKRERRRTSLPEIIIAPNFDNSQAPTGAFLASRCCAVDMYRKRRAESPMPVPGMSPHETNAASSPTPPVDKEGNTDLVYQTSRQEGFEKVKRSLIRPRRRMFGQKQLQHSAANNPTIQMSSSISWR